mmetsp:Transcript_149163/g.278054  ORF Transcript_149163/g.278054 Transcript_149163/m.278054 type:complete len:361 (+) Transcript_149163:51-1133(+)
MPLRAGKLFRHGKDATVEQPRVLPHREQVSRGQELLHMLRRPAPLSPQRSACRKVTQDAVESRFVRVEDGNADLKVVVKHTFIEVVSPRCKSRMNRSMSDSALESFQSDTAKPWDSEKPWHKSLMDKFQDMSDLSTNASAKDTCSSDEEVAGDMTSPTSGTSISSPISGESLGSPASPTLSSLCPSMNKASFVSAAHGNQIAYMNNVRVNHDPEEWRTTVMLRNVPNNYTRDMLLELVDSMGFACRYDFAYLPIDFKSHSGLGYAFINFASSADAQRLFEIFEGFSSWGVYTEKVCTVAWGSPSQGLAANVERYQNSPVMHHSIPDEWKPALFARGMRVAFPPPTKPMKPPKVRHSTTTD